MKDITIYDRELYNEQFLRHDLIKEIIPDTLNSMLDSERVDLINKTYAIDFKDLLNTIYDNLKGVNSSDNFKIYIDKSKRYKEFNIEKLVDMITFGNTSIQGYDVIYKAFSLIESNIVTIYTKWLEGN